MPSDSSQKVCLDIPHSNGYFDSLDFFSDFANISYRSCIGLARELIDFSLSVSGSNYPVWF